ncbi:sensor histidine kinase [Hwanghaeella sp.]|uniref:sensor histidine kinase n=1 Tax=Hwanghaeella sp. TaxID=2605943 RepID=UPI003CCBFCB3
MTRDAEKDLTQRYRDLILEASGDGVYGVDSNGHTIFANPAAVRLCGYTFEELIGRSPHELTHHTHPDGRHYPATECPIYAAFRDGEVHRVDDEVFWRKDGSSFPVEYISTPIVEDGKVLGAVVSFRDISKRKAVEESLRQSRERSRKLEEDLHHVSRLSAMGEMASGLAHELNQPLTAIISYVRAATRFLQGDATGRQERAIEQLDKAADQALRAGEIIRRLRQFVLKEDSVQSFEDVGDVVSEAVQLVASAVRSPNIEVEIRVEQGLPHVLMDKIRIQQVVVNLVRNAVEALEGMADGRIAVRAGTGGGEVVMVTVSDNGPGLADNVKDQLFQSFVTSKADGMGIGLSICRSIVENNGGTLTAELNDEDGMTFCFTLPVSQSTTVS